MCYEGPKDFQVTRRDMWWTIVVIALVLVGCGFLSIYGRPARAAAVPPVQPVSQEGEVVSQYTTPEGDVTVKRMRDGGRLCYVATYNRSVSIDCM